MSIVVVGSSNTDMIVKMSRIPKPGETVIGGQFSTAAGGKGANQAVAAAKAGGKVSLIARVGDDMFGRKAIEGFKAAEINIENVFIDSTEASGIAFIIVDKDGENSIAVASGANSKLSPLDVMKAKDKLQSAEVLLMQLETPVETIREASKLTSDNALIILNPAPAQELDDELLSMIDILTPNETEAELLSGIPVTDIDSAREAGLKLLRKGVKTVIVTLGKQGALLVTQEDCELISGFAVEAVDTTAAGDTFNGALALALGEGMEMKEAIRFANAAAALSVTKLGAQPSAPSRAEIEEMLYLFKT